MIKQAVKKSVSWKKTHLDCEFMLVLAVALQRDPLSRQSAMSSSVCTDTSATPVKVIPPGPVSLMDI